MKAFLSHSSNDKEFVRSVARELGRQYCIFDEQSFSTGEGFKASIEYYLDESSVFVLFASRAALESIWVSFEIDESWFRVLNNVLRKSLVYLIDSSVSINDLPEWMKRALVKRENAPKVIARDIRYHLDKLLREKKSPYFIGRSREIQEIEEIMTPLDESPPPRAVFITGLPGIGRRSLIRHTSPAILNLNKYVEIRVGEGVTVNDICIMIADHIEPYSTRDGFERIIQQIRSLSDGQALKRIVDNLRSIVAAGELPVFVDDGGLLDDEGTVRGSIKLILSELNLNDSAYIFFVTPRRPRQAFQSSFPVIHLDPLREEDTKRLVTILANQADVTITSSEVAEISTYIAGYPPAAYFAIQQAKYYGLGLLLREKSSLVQFRTSLFLKHLSNLTFKEIDKALLRLLATYSPLPLQIIADVLGCASTILNDVLIRAIDLALVIPTAEGYYRIADPITDAALKAFGYPHDSVHKALTICLYEFLQQSQLDRRRLDLSRILFRASRLAKDESLSDVTVHLASDLIKLVETLYYEHRYDEVESTAYTALQERPDNINARSYLIRSLIQRGKWQRAEEEIVELQRYAPYRDVYFHKGFLERKKGNIDNAIKAFKRARQLGARNNAINKELALCYLLTNNLELASKHIQSVLARQNDNPYVVELWLEISVRKKDKTTVRKALKLLELIGKRSTYYGFQFDATE